MKTVLYTISTLQRSGPSLVLYGLIKNLDRSHFVPVVSTLADETEVTLKPEFEKLGVKIYCLHKRGASTFLSGAFEFRQLLRRIQPDIIHANGFRDILLTAFVAPKKYKKCATVHCDWKVDYRFKYGQFIGTVSSYLQTWALKQIPCRMACSKMLADLLNKKYPHLHFDYVDNGVDTDKFYSVSDKIALRQKLNLPTDKKIIVWAGSFIPRKDPLALAKAILQIPENQYYFVFCGARGPLLDTCKELLKNRKDVLFTGYITDIEQYYQAADIYVSTSLSEGFHLTVYEAMACGLPVVLTDIDVYANLKNNPAVSFFEPKDVVALTARINELTKQDLQALGKTARQTVEQYYSAKQMAQNYMEKYN